MASLDAASPFYRYTMVTLCGIPSVRLLGTVEDWRALHDSAQRLSRRFVADLGGWFAYLLPVLATLAEQADPGSPVDNAFWRSIYKRESISGGDRVTGWATAFVRFLSQPDGRLVPKPSSLEDWTRIGEYDGIGHDRFAMHVSSVPFLWKYLEERLPMRLVGCVLAVDDEDGFVTPSLSYAVLHDGSPRPGVTARPGS